jgi:cytochrome c peroxidase
MKDRDKPAAGPSPPVGYRIDHELFRIGLGSQRSAQDEACLLRSGRRSPLRSIMVAILRSMLGLLEDVAAYGEALYPDFFEPVRRIDSRQPDGEELESIDPPISDPTICDKDDGVRPTERINLGLDLSSTSPLRRWGLWACAMLLLVSDASAQMPDLPTPDFISLADREPITQVPAPPIADALKLALGKRLFEDQRLSHDEQRACSSCHDTRTNGADSNRRDRAPDGAELELNTNTVFNAALSFRVGWAGTFRSLEAQAEASLADPAFMASTIDEVVGRLKSDGETQRQFTAAYGHEPDRESLLDAIATYERSLLTPGSKFDRWLDGDGAALSAEELEGYHLFKSLGCISCHQGVNVGGNLFERNGVFHPLAVLNPEILRVPSLRNVAATPPYFHDGSATTLGEAVRRMGAAQLNQTLSEQQVEAIVAFLGSLTGTYQGHPVTAAVP